MRLFKYVFLLFVAITVSCCIQKHKRIKSITIKQDTTIISIEDTIKKIFTVGDTTSYEVPYEDKELEERIEVGSVDPNYKKNSIPKVKKPKIKIILDTTKKVIPTNKVEIDTGRLNYALDDTMQVGESYIIEVSITKNLSKKEVVSKVLTFKDKDNIVDTIIRVTNEMEIKIIDPTGECFKITPISAENQFLEEGEVTIWRWSIIPLVDGNNDLNIVVNVIVGDSQKSYTVYDGKIHVYMKNKIWKTVWNFITNNMEWIGGSILVPVFGWLFTIYVLPYFKKKKRNYGKN